MSSGNTSRTAALGREYCLNIVKVNIQGRHGRQWYCWLLGSDDVGGKQPYGLGAWKKTWHSEGCWPVPTLPSRSAGAAHLSGTQTVRPAGEGPTGKGGFPDRGVLHCQQLRLSGLIKPSITSSMPGI